MAKAAAMRLGFFLGWAKANRKVKPRVDWGLRVKSFGLGLTLLGGLSVVSLGLVVGYQVLMASSLFQLTRLSVVGQRHLDQSQVMALAGLKLGVSLLELDLTAVESRLKASPWVARVSARRILPDELRIHLTERRPVAVILTDKAWCLGDEGVVFAADEVAKSLDLPVITGLDPERLDRHEERRSLSAAREVIRLLDGRGAPLSSSQISEIQVTAEQGLIVHPLDRGPRVILGSGGFGLKLERWRKVKSDLESRGLWSRAKYVDLRIIDRAYVGLDRG